MADTAPAGLRALQQQFLALVVAREDVPGAMARLGLVPAAVNALVAGDDRLDAVGRIGIYNDMYFLRLLEVVADDFPALAATLGEDAFRALVSDYLDAHPPRDQSLRDFARALPTFVRTHPCARARADLADLAALEWARADVFDRSDARPLAAADLAGLAPDAIAALHLRAIPTLALVDVAFAVDEPWRQLVGEDADDVVAPAAVPRAESLRLVVWRAGTTVVHRRARPVEAPLLPELCAAGFAFAAMCDRLGQDHPVETAARLAFETLAGWLADGLVARPQDLAAR